MEHRGWVVADFIAFEDDFGGQTGQQNLIKTYSPNPARLFTAQFVPVHFDFPQFT